MSQALTGVPPSNMFMFMQAQHLGILKWEGALVKVGGNWGLLTVCIGVGI